MGDAETKAGELTIEKLVYGGAGLARLEGRVVLTPFVLPGERVRVEVEKEKPGLIEASLIEVVAPAEGRAEPPCPYFYRCGGCQYQHATYETQLDQKRAILLEALRRLGRIAPPEDVRVIAGPPLEYRNRAQFHIADGAIGYFGLGTRRLVAVERCPISSPKINQALGALAGMLRDPRFPRFVRSIEVFTNETDVQLNVVDTDRPVSRRFFEWCAERIPGFAPGEIDYPAAGFLYRVRGRSFFQVNRFLMDRTVESALEGAEGASAIDLYAGVGLFSLPLARRFKETTAVESSRMAWGDLEFNAARAGIAVFAARSSAEEFLESLQKAPDFVLADPPRQGLGKRASRELLRLRPPHLTIVSCDPATLARDLAALTAGGYRLEALTLVDLFPQTFHIETVAKLSAR